MSEIVNSRYQGILVPDERFSLDNLTASDHAAAPSSYSQAGPKPGIPASQQPTRMVLQASGEQPAAKQLGIHSVRAGHPGLERAGYLWYDASEDEPVEFGWDGPQLLTGWESLFWSTDVSELSAYPDMIRLQSGRLLALGLQDKTTFVQTVKMYDPDAVTKWSTVGTITLDTPTAQKGPALCQLPSGRVLAFVQIGTQINVYFSDDDGATWAGYSYRALDVAIANDNIKQIRAGYSGGDVLLIVQYETAGGDPSAAQYASDDLGGRFTQVDDDWKSAASEEPQAFNIIENDGSFAIIYHSQGAVTVDAICRVIGSAFSKATDATPHDIGTSAASTYTPGVSAYRDDSGVIYVYISRPVGGDGLFPLRSDDGGVTWAFFAETAFFSGDADEARLHTHTAESVAGQVVLLTRWNYENGDEDPQSLAAVYLGGFSTHTAPAATDTVNFFDTDYVSFARNGGTGFEGGSWLPIAPPDQVGWTSGGVGTVDLVAGGLDISTAAAPWSIYRTVAGDGDNRLFAEFALSVDDGDGDTATNQIGSRIIIGSGVAKWEILVNVSSAGWALFDASTAAQIGSTVTADMTKHTHIRIAMDQGKVKTWWGHMENVTYREWAEGPGGNVSSVASAVASRIQWGHSVAGTNVSHWSLVGYCFWPDKWAPTSTAYASAWTSPDDLHPKSYSTEPSQIIEKTRIAAVAGPTRYDERWIVKTDYDYPARDLFPANSPSPRAAWRSTGTTEQILAWDIGGGLTEARLENSTIGIVLLGINFRTAVLESWDGALWQTVANIDSAVGLASLRFDSRGDAILPATGGAAFKAERYLMMGDLVGGTFVDLTNTKHRTISRNTEGAWTNEAAKHPTVYLDGADGTEAGSGDCELWAPSCATIAHNFTAKHRYYRLRIPAQTTASGYFEIGQVVIGSFAIFGTQYGRGRQVVARNNTELIILPNGQTRARRRGPQAREVEFAWTDGVDASQINRVDPVPDYVASSIGGDPIASLKDSLYLMDSVIARQGGAVLPVVYFARIPGASNEEQTNNPRHFVYGRITGSATRSNILGDEERTDLDRLNTITIQELV